MTHHSVLAVGINSTKDEKIKIQNNLKLDSIHLDTASIKDVMFKLKGGKLSSLVAGKDPSQYDYVLIQSGWSTTHLAYMLHLFLESQKIPHNKPTVQNTKLSDIFFLSSKGIPIPDTFFQNGWCVNASNVIEIENTCKLPCVYKTVLGSLGSNVFLVKSRKDIEKTIHKNGRYIFQEYIPNDFDYRVVVANNTATSVCKRTRVKDEFRNNVALGATEEFISVENTPKKVIDIAVGASQALQLNWSGVDVVMDKHTGKTYVLEVNRRPGLTEESTEITALYGYLKGLVFKKNK